VEPGDWLIKTVLGKLLLLILAQYRRFDWPGMLRYGWPNDLRFRQELSEMLDLFQQLNNVVDSKRKMGVEKNGLSLLLAYSIEGIQQSFN